MNSPIVVIVESVAAVGAVLAFMSGYLGFLSLLIDDSLEDISRAVDFGIAWAFPAGLIVGATVAWDLTDGHLFTA